MRVSGRVHWISNTSISCA